MKQRIVWMMIAVMALGSFSVDAQKRSKRRSTRQQTAQTASVKPRVTEQTMEQNGMKLTYKRIEADAFYKVPKDEAGASNGYSDNSFAIDWPIAINGTDVTLIQKWLLEKFTITSVSGKITSFTNIDDVVKKYSQYEGGKRVARIPGPDPEDCKKDKLDVKVYRLTPTLLGYERVFDIYTGGGTGAGVLCGSSFSNYDLSHDRELTAEICFKRGMEQVIAGELRKDPEMWDCLWDEYKASPTMTGDFKIDDKAITFYFSKYEIAPGFAGIVEVAVPMERVLPYATDALKHVLNGSQEVIGSYDDENKIKIYNSVEQMPMYPGGDAALMRDVASNLTYPQEAMAKGVVGRVVLQFVVNEDGSIGQIKVVRSVSPECDQAAIKAVKKLRRFEPGRQNGEAVKVWYTMPFNFKL